MRWWKWVGLAGLVGAAAVGTAVVVQKRKRRDWTEYEPEELRDKLHERLAAAQNGSSA